MTAQAEKLAAEFPPETLKTLPKGGTKLTYVPVAEVVARLNDVLGVGNWSYHIMNQWTEDYSKQIPVRNNGKPTGEYTQKPERWCIYHVRINAKVDGVVCERDGVGGYDLNANGMDVADAHKSGLSEALKKAAQSLGVGLSLSRDEEAMAAAALLVTDMASEEDVRAFIESMKEMPDDVKSVVREEAVNTEGFFAWNREMTLAAFNHIKAFAEQIIADDNNEPQMFDAG